MSQIQGGSTPKMLFVFENGIKAIFKPDMEGQNSPSPWYSDSNAEVAAYVLDDLLGTHLVPITVIRTAEGFRGSLQLLMSDVTNGTVDSLSAFNFNVMRVFDVISSGHDRKLLNFLFIPKSNRVVAIDHGGSFKRPCGDPAKIAKIVGQSSVARTKLMSIPLSSIRHALTPYLNPEAIQQVIKNLEVVRSSFLSAG